MSLYTFNQANGTLLSSISAMWAGNTGTLTVQSLRLQASGSGAGAFANRTAYLNEAGSLSATAKVTAGTSNDYRLILCSSDGTINFGYSFLVAGATGGIRRNDVFIANYTIPGGHNANTTDTELKIEKVGSSTINFYAGPIGSPAFVGTYSDASPISGGFSGFWFNGGGITTPGIISFDNGVSSVTYTYARPSSDITTQWSPSTGTAHFSLINETTANDADYIFATAAGQTDEVKLAAMNTPKAGTSVDVLYRVTSISGGGKVTVSLVCNTTVIATDTTRTADGDYVLTVAPATWAAVTDWSNMRLRFVSST